MIKETLGDVISLVGGGTPSKDKEEYWGNEIPWATVKDLKNSSLIKTQDSITAFGLNSSASKIVKSGSIVIATRMAVGRVVITGIDVAINQDLKGITCSNKIHTRYLYYFLSSQENYFNRVSSGATVKGIKICHIMDIEIPLPPLPEQQKIAAILDAADRLRQKNQQLIEHYTTLSQSLFWEMFGDPVTNPMGWDCEEFGCVFNSIKYGVSTPPNYSKTGIPFIRATNIKKGGVVVKGMVYISIDESKKISKCKLSEGDLIVVRSGANTGDCGRIPLEYVGAYGGFDLIIDINDPYSTFYNFLLNTGAGKAILKPLTRRAGQPHLNSKQISDLKLIAPPVSLQNQFAQHIEKIEQQKQQAQASLEKSQALFNSLLQRAFKGELTA